jgi:hypothetical protein
MIQLLATVFKPLWRTFCLNQAAFTPTSSPFILHTFLNVKLVNLSSRNTGRDYIQKLLFFILFTPINAAARPTGVIRAGKKCDKAIDYTACYGLAILVVFHYF